MNFQAVFDELSPRKQRLLLCGFARHWNVWSSLRSPLSHEAIKSAEQFADGEITANQLYLYWQKVTAIPPNLWMSQGIASLAVEMYLNPTQISEWIKSNEKCPTDAIQACCKGDDFVVQPPPTFLQVGDVVEAVYPFVLASGSGRYPYAVVVSLTPFALSSVEGDMLWTATVHPNNVHKIAWEVDTSAAFSRWKRDKQTNGLYCKRLDPAILTWNDGTILRMAQNLYDNRNWEGMPILADALMDAGCKSEAVLAHCREDGGQCPLCKKKEDEVNHPPGMMFVGWGHGWQPCSDCEGSARSPIYHVRGCWVLDLLLNKQ